MSTADSRGHWVRPFTFACLAACGGGAPPAERLPTDEAAAIARVQALAVTCPGIEQALDSITASRVSGRPLLRLVDAVRSAPTRCEDPLIATRGSTAARRLAHAAWSDHDTAALARIPGGTLEVALALRRADLLDELRRPDDARRELALVLALAPDAEAAAQHQLLVVAAAARRNDLPELYRLIAAAPIAERPRLAHRAVREVRAEIVHAVPDGGPELATAAADLLEQAGGPGEAIGPRERLVELTPEDADAWDAVARSRIAKGRLEDGLAAWDRAIAIAPAQEAFRLAPIKALLAVGIPSRASERAATLARDARASKNVELLVIASAGAALVDQALALALALDAHALRPTDGRLAFLVAQRHTDAGDKASAARAYAILLVCGAHGRAWHRHEVAAKLQELGADGLTALNATLPCEPVEPADLATYTAALRGVH